MLLSTERISAWGRGTDEESILARLKKLRTSTLGRSIRAYADLMDLPQFKDFLNPAVDARNYLYHKFFLDYDLDDENLDVAKAMRELDRIEPIVRNAKELVDQTAEPFLKAFEAAGIGQTEVPPASGDLGGESNPA